MKLISRTLMYALQATLQLAELGRDAPVPCSRLATTGKMPERFLLQILRCLVTHGILRSTRGVDGGYALVRQPEEITLLELFEAIEGPLNEPFTLEEGIDPAAQLKLQDIVGSAQARVRQELGQVRLTDFAARSLLTPPQQPA